MSKYIPDSLRLAVAERAGYCCEYCRRLESDSFIKFQIDHIISRKHRGATNLENLAYCCPICNSNKGSDVATVLGQNNKVIRLFNPRIDHWFDHFEAVDGVIHSQTLVGEATVLVLDFNNVNSILERSELQAAGLWP